MFYFRLQGTHLIYVSSNVPFEDLKERFNSSIWMATHLNGCSPGFFLDLKERFKLVVKMENLKELGKLGSTLEQYNGDQGPRVPLSYLSPPIP